MLQSCCCHIMAGRHQKGGQAKSRHSKIPFRALHICLRNLYSLFDTYSADPPRSLDAESFWSSMTWPIGYHEVAGAQGCKLVNRFYT